MKTAVAMAVAVALAGVSPAGLALAQTSGTYGTVSLRAGFTPDPHVATVVSGGTINSRDYLDGCVGWIADEPDYVVNYQAGNVFPLIFYVEADGDTTLVIADPDDEFFCDDDSGGNLNPRVHISSPISGEYAIWVGSYREGAYHQSSLFVTELSSQGR